ncbi:MAG: response regulator [Bacilli bacterium]|nr:response regulator [Bacilli bacterium]
MLSIDFLKQNNVDVDTALGLFGDINVYNETCQDFLSGIDEKLENLKKYKQENEMADYAIYAHSIKSDARYLGFNEVAKIALDHEMAGKGNDEKFVLREYDNLVAATHKMISIIRQYLGIEEVSVNKEQTQNAHETKNVILIADDSTLVTNFAIKSLEGKYDAIVANNGKEVIDIINNYPNYNIIALFLDLNMPVMGGFEVLDYFKENNLFEKIPVSIITGEDSKDMINRAFTYNICDMLVKPFNNKDVIKVADKTVNFYKNRG